MKTKLIAIFCTFISISSFANAQDFQKGLEAAQVGDYQTAIMEWRPLAEQGDAEAQHNLGVMYDNGYGVVQDYQEAEKWYRLSAEQGTADAQYNLGVMYSNGRGVVQDYQEAVKWWRLSAEQGYASAQANLGVMYYTGYGVVQDYVYAHMWLNIAAARGDASAVEKIDIVAQRMTTGKLSQAQQLARECVQKYSCLFYFEKEEGEG